MDPEPTDEEVNRAMVDHSQAVTLPREPDHPDLDAIYRLLAGEGPCTSST